MKEQQPHKIIESIGKPEEVVRGFLSSCLDFRQDIGALHQYLSPYVESPCGIGSQYVTGLMTEFRLRFPHCRPILIDIWTNADRSFSADMVWTYRPRPSSIWRRLLRGKPTIKGYWEGMFLNVEGGRIVEIDLNPTPAHVKTFAQPQDQPNTSAKLAT